MAILKCKMCGGDIELSQDKTLGICGSCGSMMTFPKIDDEQRANMFNRGNHFRRTGEFDKALAVYERIVQEDENDAEAHWCCALCRFGIEYVEDPNTFEYYPTCHRASFDSFLEDVDYLAAIEHSEGVTRRQYQKDAAKIAEVQRGILATSQNEEPFDVFICYKESEDDGTRTRDSIFAQDIYYQLTEQGRRVFFSRITLEDKAGTEYEPYIFAALNSAKVMVLVTTSAEHANAVWVKNEWSRFLSLMRKNRSKLLLPCYRDMDPYDLPEALSVLQSYDMSKIGFIQDLIRGVNKVLDANKPRETVTKETVVVQQQGNLNTTPLLKRAFMFLEDGDWLNANEYCEKVLDLDPENAEAYLGKLMAELQVRTRGQLKDQPDLFDTRSNYQKAMRFGSDKLKKELSEAITFIKNRNENAKLNGIYNGAVRAMNDAESEAAYKAAAAVFRTIPGFKDADLLTKQCLDRAEACRKNDVYAKARAEMTGETVSRYEFAIQSFRTIPEWKDADKQISICQKKIEEIKTKEEADRIERERLAEEQRIAAEKAAKIRKRVISIVAPIIAVCIAFIVLLIKVIIPNIKYNNAKKLNSSGQYEEAIAAFQALNGYKDSAEWIESCENAIKDLEYDAAVKLHDDGKYEEAIAAFQELNGYKDSAEKASAIFGEYNKEKLKDAMVGDYVFFGSYEQDNNTANGKENIEWLVLKKDKNNLLLISRYALDCQKYNTAFNPVTWEKCSLRKWLNETFIKKAFSTDEQAMIENTAVTADKNPSYSTSPGNNTTDKVFLLSILEASKYFTSGSERQCQGTAYCYAQGAHKAGNGNCWWWLRSPGYDSRSTAFVDLDGSVSNYGNFVNLADNAVRPALWINPNS